MEGVARKDGTLVRAAAWIASDATPSRRKGLACSLLAAQLFAVETSGADCDSLLADETALFETTVNLRGGDRVKRAFAVGTRAEILVIAREQGVDATLEVTNTSGRLVARADNPIRRSGIQRVVIASPSSGYFVELVGKEHSAVVGRVEVRIVAAVLESACQLTNRQLATADAAFAAGQAVTLGLNTDPSADAAAAYQQAASEYKTAVATLQEKKLAPVLLAQTQHAVATVFYPYLAEWRQAEDWAETAAQSYAQLGDVYGQARAQAIQAAALMEVAVSVRSSSASTEGPRLTRQLLGQAREMLASLAELHETRGEAYDQALNLNNFGLAFNYEGLNEEASRAFRRVLPLYEKLGERPRQAQVLTNTALAEYELGRITESMQLYEKALSLITAAEQPRLVAIALQNNALAHWAMGDYDAALGLYGEALELWRRIQDVREQARTLHGIGAVYHTIGDLDLALDFYQQALVMRSAAVDARGRTTSLRVIANILRDHGRADEALKMHEEALILATSPSIRARVLVQIAKDLDALGQRAEALRKLDAVIGEPEHGDQVATALALVERSRYRLAADELDAAEQDLGIALRTFRDYELNTNEFSTWVVVGQLQQRRANFAAALAAANRALSLAEELRLQSANPELRATLLQPLRPAFDLKISLLAERSIGRGDGARNAQIPSGDGMSALLAAEQSRARALADFQALEATAPGVSPELIREREAIYRALAARRDQLESRLDRSGPNDDRVATLRAQIAELRNRLDRIDARIGAASVASASRGSHPVELRPFELKTLPQDLAIIEYWLGETDTFAWVVTRERVVMRRVAATSAVVDTALAFHAALRNFASVPERERLQLGERLYDLVMRPVEADTAGKTRLVFAPDGALHYVPFAALRSSEKQRPRFLVERRDIAVTPSIRILLVRDAESTRHQPRKAMLLVADPVYQRSDARLTAVGGTIEPSRSAAHHRTGALLRADSGRSLERLPGTAREAAAISKLLPENTIDRLEGFTATRDRFLRAELEQYRFIHVASHAVTDSQVPQLSALILSTYDRDGRPIDGRVLAADFMSTRLNSEAVILSACDTALGKNIAGEGLVGLRYVILARGARSVASSLWPVPDDITAQLMSAMYSSLLQDRASMAAALGHAMRETIARGMTDPGMWGAFVATVRAAAN